MKVNSKINEEQIPISLRHSVYRVVSRLPSTEYTCRQKICIDKAKHLLPMLSDSETRNQRSWVLFMNTYLTSNEMSFNFAYSFL